MTSPFKKWLRIVVAFVVFVAVAIQFVRPARTNPVADPGDALRAQVDVPPDVAAIFDRSCRDCHTNETRWPWYSNVAPVSWWVIDHVDHGRSHFNLSEWQKYRPEERENLLRQACELTSKGAMPLPSYLRMHDAKLTAQDIQRLCAFTKSRRR